MKVSIVKSNYMLGNITDIPENLIQKYHVLYVGARKGQTNRVLSKGISALNWWDLHRLGYLDSYGCVVKSKFKQFDLICFADPFRVWKPVRNTYKQLIEFIKRI